MNNIDCSAHTCELNVLSWIEKGSCHQMSLSTQDETAETYVCAMVGKLGPDSWRRCRCRRMSHRLVETVSSTLNYGLMAGVEWSGVQVPGL